MKTLGQIFAVIGWLFATLLILLCIGVIVLAGSVKESFGSFGDLKVKTDRAVGVVELSGEIFGSERFLKDLRKVSENEKIKALVVRIDSPGGTVGASQEIFEAIKAVDQKKPVICSLGNVAASGGLYSALGCRKIVTNPGTLTGSIGVIMMSPNVTSLLSRFGVGMNVIKSGQYKDSGSPFREQTDADKTLLQALVNQSYQQFIQAVSTARNIPLEKVKEFADGRVILGESAVKLGLADELGNLDRAAKLALELSGGSGEPELVRPEKPSGFLRALGESEDLSFVRWLETMREGRLLYQLF